MPASSEQYRFGIDFSSVGELPGDPKARLDYFRRFRELLRQEREKIKLWHRAGAGGREVIQAHTGLIDETIKFVVSSLEQLKAHRRKNLLQRFALVAVGGYGRGELNPCSDIDLLFLLHRKIDGPLDNLIEEIISVLWGIGLEIGQSCRTLRDCQQLAQNDPTIRTSMVETRFLIGTHELYRKLWDSVRKNVLKKKSREFLNHQLKNLYRRTGTAESVTSHPEPDLKSGPGGLRDYHLAMWAVAVCFEGVSFREINREDVITRSELANLDRSVDFLLRVRNELHYLCNRKTDTVHLDIQKDLAVNLGYRGVDEPSSVRQFMHDYFMHATQIRHISSEILQRCLETRPLIPEALSSISSKKLENGFVIRKSSLSLRESHETAFKQKASGILTVFRLCRDHNLEPSARLKQLMHQLESRINDEFIRSEEVSRFLIETLEHPQSGTTLRLMHELDFLGRLLPEFGQTLFQVRYDFYHRYTTDEHSLRMIQFLEELKTNDHPDTKVFQSVYRGTADKVLLKLACLLHALGEEQPSPARRAERKALKSVFARLRLSKDQQNTLLFLIDNLNTMSEVAFHQDIHHPAIIRDFAQMVETTRRLELLYVISYIELKAVAPDTWTAWKNILLMELYFRTKNYMVRPESLVERPGTLRNAAHALLEKEMDRPAIARELDLMSEDYFLTVKAEEVVDHIRMARQLAGEPFRLKSSYQAEGGFFNMTFCCHNDTALFKNIVGILTAKALNILGAQIFTRKDDIAILMFQVEGSTVMQIHNGGTALWKEVEKDLRDVLEKRRTLGAILKGRRRLQRPYQAAAAIIPKVSIKNYPENQFTLVRIEGRDHPGMLYKIAHAFATFDVQIHRAKIATRGGRGIDVFSISQRGNKIHFAPLLQRIKEYLVGVLLVDKIEDLA